MQQTTQRKIEINWRNIPDGEHWVGLFDKDIDLVESVTEEALAVFNPPTLSKGRHT